MNNILKHKSCENHRTPLIAAFSALLLLWAPASASYYHGHNSGSNKAELELKIFGKISPKCEINLLNRRIETALTDGAGSETVEFVVNCNQVLSVTMTSENGGFEHVTRDRGESFEGFLNFLPYRATFNVDAAGATAVIAESENMVGGAGGSIGAVPFQANGSLKLDWNPEKPLLGGTFQDVIEIRVAGAGETHIPRR